MVMYNDVHVYYTLEYIIIELVEQYAFDKSVGYLIIQSICIIYPYIYILDTIIHIYTIIYT